MKKGSDSSTEVNYPQNVFSGIRKPVGFRCDTGLYSAFKPVAKAYFGSICRPLECFMIAVLALQKEQVNFGQIIVIDRINIERNLRPRRKLGIDMCGFRGCEEPAVASGVWRNSKSFRLCEKHLQQAEADLKNWRVDENSESSRHNNK